MTALEELKGQAMKLGRAAVAASSAHRKLFWEVSDGETRYLKPKRTLRRGMSRMSQGMAQDLTDKSFAREEALRISGDAWQKFNAAVEALRGESPAAALEVQHAVSRLDATSREDR